MTPLSAAQLAELKRLAGPWTTPGPWVVVNDGTDEEPMMSVKAARIAGQRPRHCVAIVATGDSPQVMENANAAFIAASRAALPSLISEVEQGRETVRKLVEALEKIAQRLNESGAGEMAWIDTIHAAHTLADIALSRARQRMQDTGGET